MQSAILDSMGLSGLDIFWPVFILIILFIITLILYLVQMSRYKKLLKSYVAFMKGKDGRSLESLFDSVFKDIETLKKSGEKDRADINALLRNILICYQKTGLVKYDAFHEMGGRLSFSLCLLDSKDNGFIINSVHSNTGCYTYSKEIRNGGSAIELGDEEKEALSIAMGTMPGTAPASEKKSGK